MRHLWLAGLGLLLAACNTTSGPVATTGQAPTAVAQSQELPPIYEPLVDMHRVNPDKYRRDLAECRQQGAPQEAAARQAQQQVAAGTALSVAGSVASLVPVSSFRQARTLYAATDTAQAVGGSVAEGGAVKQDQAMQDYVLVVNICLMHKRYRLLR